MTLIVDADHLGTSEETWREFDRLGSLATLDSLSARRVVLVAPHPDDEIFGAGGLLQHALRLAISIEVVAVTDGEGSHRDSRAVDPVELGRRRPHESLDALRRLGWERPVVTRLRLPDGDVAAHASQLRDALVDKLRPGDWCVAPWCGDGHPDHDACGIAARDASRRAGVKLLGFLVWTWHWASPELSTVPWRDCRRLPLSRRESARKRWATSAFESQIRPVGPLARDAPVMPAPLLRRFWRPYEVYVDDDAVGE